jgi:hypothetical protein
MFAGVVQRLSSKAAMALQTSRDPLSYLQDVPCLFIYRHVNVNVCMQGEVQSLANKAATALRTAPASGARDLLMLHGRSLAIKALLVQVGDTYSKTVQNKAE